MIPAGTLKSSAKRAHIDAAACGRIDETAPSLTPSAMIFNDPCLPCLCNETHGCDGSALIQRP
jgi:hypothetical protein